MEGMIMNVNELKYSEITIDRLKEALDLITDVYLLTIKHYDWSNQIDWKEYVSGEHVF